MTATAGQPFTIQDFQAKWRDATLTERSAAQQHFVDLCRALGMPAPADEDKSGTFSTFEKGAAKASGGKGFADVWWDGKFGWEYKGRHADLTAAYRQLLQYREDLGNPPLLVVCDLHRSFEAYPLPWPPGEEPWREARLHAIAGAARALDEQRRAWLDPAGASEAELKKRTLTNL